MTPTGVQQVYRWVRTLSYTDDSTTAPGRLPRFNAQETVAGQTTTWAWITELKVTAETVIDVATKGGRHRWHIENQGFNTQKNSGLNLEHAYSHRCWQAFYYLLQIAHLHLATGGEGQSPAAAWPRNGARRRLQLFGSLKNIARRMLDSLRFRADPRGRGL